MIAERIFEMLLSDELEMKNLAIRVLEKDKKNSDAIIDGIKMYLSKSVHHEKFKKEFKASSYTSKRGLAIFIMQHYYANGYSKPNKCLEHFINGLSEDDFNL